MSVLTPASIAESLGLSRRPGYGLAKRLFDVVGAAAGLVVLSPLLLLAAVAVRLESGGPVIFRQTRVGRGFRFFSIYKFRTMTPDAPRNGPQITAGSDARITRVGRILRHTKLDELPQLVNILRGDMSFVGPRPEVPRYVELFRRDYEVLLTVRPGITDLASIAFRHEAALLGAAADAEEEYVRRVLPEKIRLAREYLRRRSLGFDLALILKTVWSLAR